jgi:hypothetical protein
MSRENRNGIYSNLYRVSFLVTAGSTAPMPSTGARLRWGGRLKAGAQVRSMDAAEVLTLYAGSTLRQDRQRQAKKGCKKANYMKSNKGRPLEWDAPAEWDAQAEWNAPADFPPIPADWHIPENWPAMEWDTPLEWDTPAIPQPSRN